ncbi:hypothetical protein BsWGS_03431 [Bradybaena similaris]
MVIHEEGCEFGDRCYPVGSSFEDASITYNCTKLSEFGETRYISRRITVPPCLFNNNIYEHGALISAPTLDSNCQRISCYNSEVRYSREGCVDVWTSSGICRPRGYVIVMGCSNFTCDESDTLVRTRAACRGSYGACHDVGSALSILWYGRRIQCICGIRDSYTTMYSCTINN